MVNKISHRLKIRRKIRRHINGTLEIPRLSVYKSNKFIYAQLINDVAGHTLVAASSRNLESPGIDLEKAKKVGELMAKLAAHKGIKKVVFDRSGYCFHGRVKALAVGARTGGLDF